MTTYYVSSVDGNDADNGTTWALAKATLAGAIAVATTAGDIIKVSHVHIEEIAANVTYQPSASIEIWSVNRASSDAPTVMGTGAWIGNSTTNKSITISPVAGGTLYIFGLTLRTAGTSIPNLILGAAAGQTTIDSCYLWQGSTATTAAIVLGGSTATLEVYLTLKNCTLRFAAVEQTVTLRNVAGEIKSCTVSSSGSAITTLFSSIGSAGGPITVSGCDLSYVNTTLIGDQASGYRYISFVNCKLPASWVLVAASTAGGRSGCDGWIFDSHSGDEHIHLAHANGLGSTVCDTGIYVNDNVCDTNLSWKIIGTSAATTNIPYEAPLIPIYNTGTSEITPYLECVRSGNATAYNNNEVWSEWSYKGTSASTLSSFINDSVALGGTPAAQTSSSKGASDWTGENATSWFGKLGESSMTPAEVGHIYARVCVAGANTVYVDPQIRGLS